MRTPLVLALGLSLPLSSWAAGGSQAFCIEQLDQMIQDGKVAGHEERVTGCRVGKDFRVDLDSRQGESEWRNRATLFIDLEKSTLLLADHTGRSIRKVDMLGALPQLKKDKKKFQEALKQVHDENHRARTSTVKPDSGAANGDSCKAFVIQTSGTKGAPGATAHICVAPFPAEIVRDYLDLASAVRASQEKIAPFHYDGLPFPNLELPIFGKSGVIEEGKLPVRIEESSEVERVTHGVRLKPSYSRKEVPAEFFSAPKDYKSAQE